MPSLYQQMSLNQDSGSDGMILRKEGRGEKKDPLSKLAFVNTFFSFLRRPKRTGYFYYIWTSLFINMLTTPDRLTKENAVFMYGQ